MDDKDNIVEFKPISKPSEDKPIFKETKTYRHSLKCPHGEFKINESTDTVKCGLCGEKLSPMWVLKLLANKNTQLYWQWVDMEKKAEETRNKLRCKCSHCGKMTQIQR
ncbi:TPA: hypothetical protein ACMDRZ_002996 [Vibrio cholerae]|uniref:Uncharacterized protein n=1 Tax=Vibrio vulnificus TaxID=672 RepID=A0AAI8ZLK7_VIBVL|nr:MULTISPECIES: hypothetical protein [Vibrio]EHU8077638.1 hypothetical protein [Vibrio cholerae]EHV9953694.1 hypothetical protein [Vibrio cholerae]EKF9218919.1 hypothetical protein [Vibrio cholerae]OQK43730.1 hypothetical protein XM75_u0011 [Vibrio vulnificus]PAS33419.1 hypothetical protein CGT72_10155 [Vibrio cholerae]